MSEDKPQRRKYPSISLEKAIDRVEVVYQHEKRTAANLAAITGHWGFKSPKTGPASTTYSAVKQYGLLDEEGYGSTKKIRISQLGYEILQAPEKVKRDAIKRAALVPSVFQVIRAAYPDGTGSDSSFKWYLENDLGFTNTGAADLAKSYLATIRFAGLDGDSEADDPSDEVDEADESDEDSDQVDVQRGRFRDPAELFTREKDRKRSPSVSRHSIPLIGGKQVVLEGEFPLTEAAWKGFIVVLNAFKPGLVEGVGSDEATN